MEPNEICPDSPGSLFRVAPETHNCRRLLQGGEHALLGVSPFNGRFSRPYLAKLGTWAGRTSRLVKSALADADCRETGLYTRGPVALRVVGKGLGS
ncbi:hypothetical protein METEAL_38530 [Mesoterricola silvestris]|uniref:Cyclodipeptide synthase n=2 Tax=Mesoterricola silvestris TaxID=2927979 RepID=A0AA48GNP1_9BACT|nr:hypothetical protein METEAL_38530 [Mesoterricola silvestris]